MAARSNKPRKRSKRRRAAVVVVNRPRRRSRHGGRRNPPVMSVAGVLERGFNGALGGATIVATEIGARAVRGKVFKMPAGELLSGATELGLTTAAGLAVEHFVGGRAGQRYGQLIIDAGAASVIRATIKQMKAPWVADVLGDDTRRLPYVIDRNGRVMPRAAVNGYVGGADRARMNGYVPGGRPPLGGYVPGNAPYDMAAAGGRGGGYGGGGGG